MGAPLPRSSTRLARASPSFRLVQCSKRVHQGSPENGALHPHSQELHVKQFWREKGLLHAPYVPSRGEVGAGSQRQRQKQRPWENAVCWLAPCSLLSLLSSTIPDRLPGEGTAHGGLRSPTPIISQESLPTGQSGGRRHFLNWGSLFPDDSSLYKLTNYKPAHRGVSYQ